MVLLCALIYFGIFLLVQPVLASGCGRLRSFVTSVPLSANLTAGPRAVYTAAESHCNSVADTVNLSPSVSAWAVLVSVAAWADARTVFEGSTCVGKPVTDVTGAHTVAPSVAALFDGVTNPSFFDENGQAVVDGTLLLTGSQWDGTLDGADCDGWTGVNDGQVRVGKVGGGVGSWISSPETLPCSPSTTLHVLCVERHSDGPLTQLTVGVNQCSVIFKTSVKTDGRMFTDEAGAASDPVRAAQDKCTELAGSDYARYFIKERVQDGLAEYRPWLSVSGRRNARDCMPRFPCLLTTEVNEPLFAMDKNQLLARPTQIAVPLKWSEKGLDNTAANWAGSDEAGFSSNSDCEKWTSNSLAVNGAAGREGGDAPHWSFYEERSCDKLSPILCFTAPAPPPVSLPSASATFGMPACSILGNVSAIHRQCSRVNPVPLASEETGSLIQWTEPDPLCNVADETVTTVPIPCARAACSYDLLLHTVAPVSDLAPQRFSIALVVLQTNESFLVGDGTVQNYDGCCESTIACQRDLRYPFGSVYSVGSSSPLSRPLSIPMGVDQQFAIRVSGSVRWWKMSLHNEQCNFLPPSQSPSSAPSPSPTFTPSSSPTLIPSSSPTLSPTLNPTASPTSSPSLLTPSSSSSSSSSSSFMLSSSSSSSSLSSFVTTSKPTAKTIIVVQDGEDILVSDDDLNANGGELTLNWKNSTNGMEEVLDVAVVVIDNKNETSVTLDLSIPTGYRVPLISPQESDKGGVKVAELRPGAPLVDVYVNVDKVTVAKCEEILSRNETDASTFFVSIFVWRSTKTTTDCLPVSSVNAGLIVGICIVLFGGAVGLFFFSLYVRRRGYLKRRRRKGNGNHSRSSHPHSPRNTGVEMELSEPDSLVAGHRLIKSHSTSSHRVSRALSHSSSSAASTAGYMRRPMHNWSISDVKHWISDVCGLEQFASEFSACRISGPALLSMQLTTLLKFMTNEEANRVIELRNLHLSAAAAPTFNSPPHGRRSKAGSDKNTVYGPATQMLETANTGYDRAVLPHPGGGNTGYDHTRLPGVAPGSSGSHIYDIAEAHGDYGDLPPSRGHLYDAFRRPPGVGGGGSSAGGASRRRASVLGSGYESITADQLGLPRDSGLPIDASSASGSSGPVRLKASEYSKISMPRPDRDQQHGLTPNSSDSYVPVTSPGRRQSRRSSAAGSGDRRRSSGDRRRSSDDRDRTRRKTDGATESAVEAALLLQRELGLNEALMTSPAQRRRSRAYKSGNKSGRSKKAKPAPVGGDPLPRRAASDSRMAGLSLTAPSPRGSRGSQRSRTSSPRTSSSGSRLHKRVSSSQQPPVARAHRSESNLYGDLPNLPLPLYDQISLPSTVKEQVSSIDSSENEVKSK